MGVAFWTAGRGATEIRRPWEALFGPLGRVQPKLGPLGVAFWAAGRGATEIRALGRRFLGAAASGLPTSRALSSGSHEAAAFVQPLLRASPQGLPGATGPDSAFLGRSRPRKGEKVFSENHAKS